MANIDLLFKALDTAHWELGEGFKGLPDVDVWKRAHPRLLSVGELAAHLGYWESKSFLAEELDSPLIVAAARYYTVTAEEPFSLDLGAEAVYAEVTRIHEACKAAYLAAPHDSEEQNPLREGWTWGFTLTYQAFHFAYHTGQIYSVRHLLGHQTVDN